MRPDFSPKWFCCPHFLLQKESAFGLEHRCCLPDWRGATSGLPWPCPTHHTQLCKLFLLCVLLWTVSVEPQIWPFWLSGHRDFQKSWLIPSTLFPTNYIPWVSICGEMQELYLLHWRSPGVRDFQSSHSSQVWWWPFLFCVNTYIWNCCGKIPMSLKSRKGRKFAFTVSGSSVKKGWISSAALLDWWFDICYLCWIIRAAVNSAGHYIILWADAALELGSVLWGMKGFTL